MKVPNARKRSSIKNIPIRKESISKSNFIKLIFENNFDNVDKINNNIFVEYNLLSHFKACNFCKILNKINFVSKKINKFIISNMKNKNTYTSLFIHLILFIIEENKFFDTIQKNVILRKYSEILTKLYQEKLVDKNNLLIIIEFISLLSIYDRNDFISNEMPKNRIIKKYNFLKYSLEIIIKINEAEIAENFLKFINSTILKQKANLFLITEKTDFLKLININPIKRYIIDFLANIYSFKYSKNFLDVFIKQIKDIYALKNNNNPTIEVLKYLQNDINLLKSMQEIELKKYKQDPFILNQGFVINNNSEKTSAVIKEIIVKEQFTMVFSFNYSPDDKSNNDNNNPRANSVNVTNKSQKIKKDIIPIIELIKEDVAFNEVSGFSFFIQGGWLIHRKYNSIEEKKICQIVNNQTYMCYYSILEGDHYLINVKSAKDIKSNGIVEKEPIKFLLKNKLKLQIGKFFNQSNSSFEGYIGPILLFNTCLNNDYRKNIFALKGSYDKMLYFDKMNSKFIDKFDKDMNFHFLNEFKENNYNNYISAKNFFIKEKNKIFDSLIYNITPIYQGSSLTKKDYINSFPKEYKINFATPPHPMQGCVYFFRNLSTPMEFLKYEGVNFLIMCFELIIANIDHLNMDNIENERITILNLFSYLIPYIQDLIFLLKVDYYESDIRHILFALEKCVNKLCVKFKMVNEIAHELNNWIKSLTTEISPYIKSYIKIRNEMCKFLLDPKLYNMKDYSSLEIFFVNLNNCINLRPEGLMNMEIFYKILLFTSIYKTVTKRKDIRRTREFKGYKGEMNKILLTYFRKCGFIKPYKRLIEILSDSMNYNFKKYQLLKIFYIESKYYFDNIESEKSHVLTWKYFINLFQYLQAHESFEDITLRQSHILMALALRIIIEYPIIGNFFKENQFIKFKKKPTNDNENEIEENFKKIIKSKKVLQLRESFSDKKLNKYNTNDKKKFKLKRSTSFSKVSSSKIIRASVTINDEEKKIQEKRKSSIDLIRREQRIVRSNFFEYADFFTYGTLMTVLDSSYKLNDYMLRVLILLILETNNKVNINQETKLKFITKIKKFEDFKSKEYASFLKFTYINREIKTQLINIVKYIVKNADNITHISYDLFLYLILNVCKNRVKNKCVYNHLVSSKKIFAEIFICALNNDKEAYNLIFKYFFDLSADILPYHKKPFLTEFLYQLISSKNQYLRNYGKILINTMLVTNLNRVKNEENIFCMKMNSISLIYRIIKTKDIIPIAKDILFSDKGLYEFYNNHLITTKINIFKNVLNINKKKCYVEALFEILIFHYVHSNNRRF